jgi:two-component system, response regulator YesN
MRLLIVDDEDLERESLQSGIARLNLDIEVCGSAWNGREALEAAEKLQPDIVLTDVRMPVMDGIAFARALRERNPSCFILFISGFEDFQAAREALAVGGSAWLVKPVNLEELRAALSAVCDTAMETGRRKQEEDRRNKRLEELLPLGRQEFIRSLLLNGDGESADTAERASELGISLFPGKYAVLVAEVQAGLGQEGVREDFLPELARALRFPDALEPVVMPGIRLAMVLMLPGIAAEETSQTRLEAVAEQMLLRAAAGAGGSVGVGVSLIGSSAGEIGALYAQACAALEDKLRYGRGRVIFFSENPQQSGADSGEHIVLQVEKIVAGEIDGDLSAEAVARRVFITASHLRRVFKNRTGVTLQDYVLRMRMERARDLLQEPGCRVHAVAAKVGYDSTSYFCLVFKRFFGMTPGDFRIGSD